MGVVAVLRATRGLVIVRQSLASLEAFGDLRGTAWVDTARRHASGETRRLAFAAVEEAAEVGGVVRVRLWDPVPAELTARRCEHEEAVLTTWRPLTHEERVEAFMARWPDLGDR